MPQQHPVTGAVFMITGVFIFMSDEAKDPRKSDKNNSKMAKYLKDLGVEIPGF